MRNTRFVISVLVLCHVCSVFKAVAADIAFDSSSSTCAIDANSISWSHTVGSGDNRVIIVGIGCEDWEADGLAVDDIKYCDMDLTLVPASRVLAGTSTIQKTELYYLLDPPSGTYTLSVNYSGTIRAICAGAVSLSNVRQAAPYDANANAVLGPNSVSTNVSVQTAGSWAVDVVKCTSPGTLIVVGSGGVEQWQQDPNDDGCAAGGAKVANTIGTAAMTWRCSDVSTEAMCHSVAVFEPYLENDIDGDGKIDLLDLGILAANWLGDSVIADLDDSNDVNFVDYSMLAVNLMKGTHSGEKVKIGWATDLHYALRNPMYGRYYDQILTYKLPDFLGVCQSEGVDFLMLTGDLIEDRGDSREQQTRLNEELFAVSDYETHVAVGNHDIPHLGKDRFLEITGEYTDNNGVKAGYYSFDKGDYHFVVLDASYDCEGYDHVGFYDTVTYHIPQHERYWLIDDLAANIDRLTFVFVHLRIDTYEYWGSGAHNTVECVDGEDVRTILETAGNVRAVFQGHMHANKYKLVNGIHYFTMAGMVDGNYETNPGNNAYAIIDISSTRVIMKPYKWAINPVWLPQFELVGEMLAN